MSTPPQFADRQEAGIALATALMTALQTAITTGRGAAPIVYGLPNGGLPLAAIVAQRLACPLDVAVAKKVALPEQPELAIAAVTATGKVVYPSATPPPDLDTWRTALMQAQTKAQNQVDRFAADRPTTLPTGRIAILVDDGMATGLTMLAAVQAIRAAAPHQIWLAVPVAPPETCRIVQPHCDRLIVLAQPKPFGSVSRFYRDFPQISFAAAQACLQAHNHYQ